MRIPFNILDEAFVHIDDPVQPLTVQIEARVAGRLDDERLRRALREAAATHPLARARVVPWHGRAPHPEWHIDERPTLDPLLVVDVGEDGDIDRLRGELLSTPISLYESPPWRARLVHAPAGDVVMLSVHHAASDGIGCLRLLQSVLRHYAGVPDPTPDLDPLAAHALDAGGPSTKKQRAAATLLELRKLGHVASAPTRVAPVGATDATGYGIVTRCVAARPVVTSALRRRLGASVNDLLLAVLHLTLDRWNTAQEHHVGRIAIHMPINARPAEWRNEVVGNLVTGETVATTPDQRTTPEACLQAVAGWTEAIKKRGPEPALERVAAVPRLPIDLKRAVITGATAIGGRFADTSVLSNVGHVRSDWIDSDEITVEEVLFSPPTAMPMGVGLGAAATDEHLSLSFRHRYALLDRSAAIEFADLHLDTLDSITSAS